MIDSGWADTYMHRQTGRQTKRQTNSRTDWSWSRVYNVVWLFSGL